MPLYDFVNSNGESLEFFFTMKQAKPNLIKITKKKIIYYFEDGSKESRIRQENENQHTGLYKRVFSPPNVNIDSKKPKTIGDLARKNTTEAEKKGIKVERKKKKEQPWWRKGKVNTKLGSLSQKQKEKYIMTGKI